MDSHRALVEAISRGTGDRPAGRANHKGERKYAIAAHEDPEWLLEHEIDLELENRFEQPGFQAD